MQCIACDEAIPRGLTACPACRTPVEFSTEDRRHMDVDIRARVLWGDDPEEIRRDWIRKGAPEVDIQNALDLSHRERRTHFKIRGLQDLGLALVLFLATAASVWTVQEHDHGVPRFRGRTRNGAFVTGILCPVAGVVLTIRGIRRIRVGGESAEAASDVTGFD